MASVWANEECTERPTVGQQVSTVYVKLARAFNVNDAIEIGSASNQGQYLHVDTPTTEVPDVTYTVVVWDVDLISADYESPFTADQVVQCSTEYPVTVGADFVMDFYA